MKNKMKKENWSKIGTIEYYGEVDSLDGKELKEGELIEIQFPDSETDPYIATPIVFSVHTKIGEMQTQVDMSGGPDTHRYSKAFVNIDYHGLSVPIYLRDHKELKLRRVKK